MINLFFLSFGLSALIYFMVARNIYRTSNSSIFYFGYSYLFLSFFVGVLNYFLFRWFLANDIFTEAFYKAYFLWFLGFIVYSLLCYFAPINSFVFKVDDRFLSANYSAKTALLLTLIVIGGSISAFIKAGTIPMLASNIEEARSAMVNTGILTILIFLNTFSILICYASYSVNRSRQNRVLLIIAICTSFVVLAGYGMRNFVLITLFGMLFLREILNGKKIPVTRMVVYGLGALLFLYFIGQIRSNHGSTGNSIQTAMRLLSGTFSEFREWPSIFSSSNIGNVNPLRYLAALIPGAVFSTFGIDKLDIIFSSGWYFKELLGREFDGAYLGLRTSLYGDLYLVIGWPAFFVFSILYFWLARRVVGWSTSLEKLCLSILTLMILFIGFSSELSTLIIKIFFLLVSFFVLKLIRSFLRGLKFRKYYW